MSFFRTYQKELVSAVVGAAIAGLLSMAAGLYSLTKSFEYAQNKEQLASLRKDLEFLARVRNEVDANTQTLVGTDYRISAKFGEPMDWLSPMLTVEKGKKPPSVEQLNAFKAMGGGPIVPVLELSAPREKLVVESWGNQFPESGDIAFDLLADINEYYRRIRRINLSVERMENMSAGSGISVGFHASLVKDIEHHNAQLEDLRKLDTVKLKNRINDEIHKLSESRKKLSSAIGVG
jgi:hypothetical protein